MNVEIEGVHVVATVDARIECALLEALSDRKRKYHPHYIGKGYVIDEFEGSVYLGVCLSSVNRSET